MLVFYSYGVQFHQLISSDFLPLNWPGAFAAWFVPAGAAVGAMAYNRTGKNVEWKPLLFCRKDADERDSEISESLFTCAGTHL